MELGWLRRLAARASRWKPGHGARVREQLLMEDFQHHRLVQDELAGPVNAAHPALSDALLDAVLPGDHLAHQGSAVASDARKRRATGGAELGGGSGVRGAGGTSHGEARVKLSRPGSPTASPREASATLLRCRMVTCPRCGVSNPAGSATCAGCAGPLTACSLPCPPACPAPRGARRRRRGERRPHAGRNHDRWDERRLGPRRTTPSWPPSRCASSSPAGRLAVEDAGGGNGVFVRLRGERELPVGGELRLGRQRLLLELVPPGGGGRGRDAGLGLPGPGLPAPHRPAPRRRHSRCRLSRCGRATTCSAERPGTSPSPPTASSPGAMRVLKARGERSGRPRRR